MDRWTSCLERTSLKFPLRFLCPHSPMATTPPNSQSCIHTLSAASTLAPFATSASTTGICPLSEARCRGVWPSCRPQPHTSQHPTSDIPATGHLRSHRCPERRTVSRRRSHSRPRSRRSAQRHDDAVGRHLIASPEARLPAALPRCRRATAGPGHPKYAAFPLANAAV